DAGAAARAQPAGAAVDAGGEPARDPGPQEPPGHGGELEQPPVGDGRRGAEGIQADLPQRLRLDDVPDPGEDALVEQELADRPVDGTGPTQVLAGVEAAVQQVGAE